MTDTATNEPEVVLPPDPLQESQALLATATTRIKTLEQEIKDCWDLRNEDVVNRQKLVEEFKLQGTVIGWKVFLESVFYLAWLLLTITISFIPLYQALIRGHHYVHLYGTVLGVISGWVFYVIIRNRPNFR